VPSDLSSSDIEEVSTPTLAPPVQEPRERTPIDPRSISLSVVAVLAVVFALHWAAEILIPLAISILVTYALNPIVTWMQNRKIPRAIGAAVLLLSLAGGVGYLSVTLRDDATAAIASLPHAMEKLSRSLRKNGGGEGTIEKVQKAASELEVAAREATGQTAPPPPRGVTRVEIAEPRLNLREYLWWGSMGALALVGELVLGLFLVYFLLVSGDLYTRKLVKLAGTSLSKKKITVQILDEINTRIQRHLLVLLLTGVFVSMTTWMAFLVIGFNHAGVWGIAAGILNLIPYLGPLIVLGGTAVVGFLQFGTIEMAALVGGVSLVITGLEGFLLTPWLTGRATQVNVVAIFVSLMFWGWLWGPWGLLLATPMVIVFKAICDHVEHLNPFGELMGT
jgi:predicted PurR-regulated permease PerM